MGAGKDSGLEAAHKEETREWRGRSRIQQDDITAGNHQCRGLPGVFFNLAFNFNFVRKKYLHRS